MPTSSRGSRRDFAELEARRFRAAELFARGESQAAVARTLGVTTASVNHWHQAWRTQGRRGLKAAGRAGRKPRLGPADLATVERALRAGPAAHGFATEVWTLPRVAAVIERLTGVAHHPGHVWRVPVGTGTPPVPADQAALTSIVLGVAARGAPRARASSRRAGARCRAP